MDYTEISREECSEALAKIITVLSEIILDPHENKTSVYPKAAEAFNSIADEVGFDGPRFGEVTFNEDFDRDAAKLFYGVGDTTIGMTHSFWAGGLITVTGPTKLLKRISAKDFKTLPTCPTTIWQSSLHSSATF